MYVDSMSKFFLDTKHTVLEGAMIDEFGILAPSLSGCGLAVA